MYLLLKHAFRLILLCGLPTLFGACGHVVIVADDFDTGDGVNEVDNTPDSDTNRGGTAGVFGNTTMLIATESYDVLVSVGQTVPVARLESDTGAYTLEGDMAF